MTTPLIFDPTPEPMADPLRFTSSGSQKFWGRLMAGLMALWIVLVSFGAQLIGWAGPALGLTSTMTNVPVWASFAQAGLIGIPLLLLVFLWRTARYRAMFQTWLWATGFLLLLAPTRWLFPTQGQLILLLQICASVICLVLTCLSQRFATESQIQNDLPLPSRILLALGAAAIFAYPWLVWGALGSVLDSLLGLVAGLLFGWTASAILRGYWLRSLQFETRGLFRDLATGGFVAGLALLIMASAFSFNGAQLVLMLALPALGWAAIGLSATREPTQASLQWRGMAWLIGLAAAIMILLVDPDGMGLEVQDGILRWSFQAALVALLIGWLLGLVVLVARHHLANFRPTQWTWLAVLLLWVGGGAFYFTAGAPGLYGDQIFVILKDQADVSSAATIKNYDERRRFVYTTLVNQAEASQANLRKTLDQFGVEYTPYYLVNAIEVRG
ncbi:MAG: hypothetical protein NT075_03570, partial [Chloroflexi bacterium]|nr:hypothetical protein [Chloroflexota bacterium]